MKTIEELRERHEEIRVEMDQIHESLKEATDELDVEQSTRFDTLNAEQKAVMANIKRANDMQILEEQAGKFLPRLTTASGPPLDAEAPPGTETLPDRATVVTEAVVDEGGFRPPAIPASALKRCSKLKAFTGPDAEKKAYRAGQFYLAVSGNENGIKFCHSHGLLRAAQSEGVNAAGGVFVPEELSQTIIDLKEQYGKFRANTNVVPMSSDTKIIPRRTGGLTVYFIGENSEATSSDAAWNNIRLVAHKAAVLNKISSELMEDAVVDMGDKITVEAAYAIAKKEDDCGFIGDGTSTYGGMTGVINAMGAGSYFSMGAGDRAFSDVTLADFESTMAKLPQYALENPNCKWYISSVGFASSMQRLADAAGGNTIATLMAGMQKTWMGFPVVITQSLHNLTTDAAINTVIILFGVLDLATTLGDRRVLTVKMSSDRYLEFDQVGILYTTRFDIVANDVGDASTAGAMVGLRTGPS